MKEQCSDTFSTLRGGRVLSDAEGCLRLTSALCASCVQAVGTTTGVFTRPQCDEFLHTHSPADREAVIRPGTIATSHGCGLSTPGRLRNDAGNGSWRRDDVQKYPIS